MKRGLTPSLLGGFVGLMFGALLVGYLFMTGILDVTSSGNPAGVVMGRALVRACRDLVPWLLVWVFATPALQRIPFWRPWLALVASAGLAVLLVPELLGIDGLTSLQLAALTLFALILTLPIVRANDVLMVASFFCAMHIVTVSIVGMPFGEMGSGVFAGRLNGDALITGGILGPVFGFAGMLGQVWIAAAMLRHQTLVFAGARARFQPRAAGLRQLVVGLALAAAGAGLMFVLMLATRQIRIESFAPSWATLTDSLTTALPDAMASAIVTCLIGVTLVYAVARRGWLAAIIVTAVAVGWHLQSPVTNAYTAAGVGAMTLAMTLAFAETGRLWMPIGLAFGWSLFEGPIFGFPTNGFPIRHPWFQQEVLRYSTLTGGIIGPAASVFAIGAKCLVVAGVAWLARRDAV